MNILFNGGAVWGFCEYIGALQYIREHKLTFDKVYGVSAGSAIAALYVLEIEMSDIIEMWTNALSDTSDSITAYQLIGCEFLFKGRKNAYKLANDRLFIGITGENGFFWKSKFKSNRDLGNALICGGTIPLLSSYNGTIHNKYAIDGGIGISVNDVPPNTRVVAHTARFPLSVTPPSPFVVNILQAIGYYKMRIPCFTAKCININESIQKVLFFIQKYQPKTYNKRDIVC